MSDCHVLDASPETVQLLLLVEAFQSRVSFLPILMLNGSCGISHEDRGITMPVIRVEMLSGRTQEQKRKLSKAFTEAFVETCGGEPEGVQVIFRDVDKGNWAVGGNISAET
jgi:4-oxalocrotonate tautomerase